MNGRSGQSAATKRCAEETESSTPGAELASCRRGRGVKRKSSHYSLGSWQRSNEVRTVAAHDARPPQRSVAPSVSVSSPLSLDLAGFEAWNVSGKQDRRSLRSVDEVVLQAVDLNAHASAIVRTSPQVRRGAICTSDQDPGLWRDVDVVSTTLMD